MDDRARPVADVGVRAILADLCRSAREEGPTAAQTMATAQIVAAAAYLGDQVGAERTISILSATIASIATSENKKH